MSMEWRKSTRSDGVEDHACVEVAVVIDGSTAAEGMSTTPAAI
jgi:Domain of unknown function (DUF397)